MKTTYNRTMLKDNEQLQKATVTLDITTGVKYEADAGEETTVTYTGLTQWSIITGEDALEIEADIDEIDEYHEYLVLEFNDGTTATFRNSHVDMFIL